MSILIECDHCLKRFEIEDITDLTPEHVEPSEDNSSEFKCPGSGMIWTKDFGSV